MRLHTYKVIGTQLTIYEAYEDYDNHSSIMTFDGKWMGRVGTRRLTEELEALPAYSDERIQAVTAWQEAEYEEAYDFILSQVPELARVETHKNMGSIETYFAR
jgi:hypothetical protein